MEKIISFRIVKTVYRILVCIKGKSKFSSVHSHDNGETMVMLFVNGVTMEQPVEENKELRKSKVTKQRTDVTCSGSSKEEISCV